MPEGLWSIAWMAKKGDEKAKEALDRLLEVADRLGVREYFEERVRPVELAGTKSAVGRRVTVEGVAVEITDFKVEWVKFEDPNKPCSWPAEPCRPKVVVEYVHGGGKDEFTVAWGVGEENTIRASVRMNALYRAAALIAVAAREGYEEEIKRIIDRAKKGGTATLSLDNLLAMAQYDETLLEWAMEIRRSDELRREKGKSTRESRRYKTL